MKIRRADSQTRINHFVNNCGASREEAYMLVIVELERALAATTRNMIEVTSTIAIDAEAIRDEYFKIKAQCFGSSNMSSVA